LVCFWTAKKPVNQEAVIATYKRLIHSMAHANQYLLLYVLDLLSVFSRKSDKNLMTAQSKLRVSCLEKLLQIHDFDHLTTPTHTG
jgi:hypothetical protein